MKEKKEEAAGGGRGEGGGGKFPLAPFPLHDLSSSSSSSALLLAKHQPDAPPLSFNQTDNNSSSGTTDTLDKVMNDSGDSTSGSTTSSTASIDHVSAPRTHSGGKNEASSVRLVVQRCDAASLAHGTSSSLGPVCSIKRGLVVYVSFTKDADASAARKAGKLLLKLPLLSASGSWGDETRPLSFTRLRSQGIPVQIMILPQAALVSRVRKGGLQYRDQCGRGEGAALYTLFVETIVEGCCGRKGKVEGGGGGGGGKKKKKKMGTNKHGGDSSLLVSPMRMFQDEERWEGQFSAYDDDGLPTRDREGKPLSKGRIKKYRKIQMARSKKYEAQRLRQQALAEEEEKERKEKKEQKNIRDQKEDEVICLPSRNDQSINTASSSCLTQEVESSGSTATGSTAVGSTATAAAAAAAAAEAPVIDGMGGEREDGVGDLSDRNFAMGRGDSRSSASSLSPPPQPPSPSVMGAGVVVAGVFGQLQALQVQCNLGPNTHMFFM